MGHGANGSTQSKATIQAEENIQPEFSAKRRLTCTYERLGTRDKDSASKCRVFTSRGIVGTDVGVTSNCDDLGRDCYFWLVYPRSMIR